MSQALQPPADPIVDAQRVGLSAQLPQNSMIGSFASIGGLTTVIAVSEALVVVGKYYGFDLYDTSDPAQPILLSHVMMSNVPYDAVFAGSKL